MNLTIYNPVNLGWNFSESSFI